MRKPDPMWNDAAMKPVGASKESGPKGPGFGYPQRGFALLKVHYLIEISNTKSQKTNK